MRVPVSERLGEENAAWPLVRYSLGHERAAGAMNQSAMYRRVLDELIDLTRRHGLTDRPDVRQGLVDFEIRLRVMRSSAMRIISDIVIKGEPGPISSASRLFVAAFEQDLHEFAVDALGMYGVLDRDEELAVQRSRWTMGFLRTRASTIGTGTSQIQRNTVAERVLGLPREPVAGTVTVADG
ncbi:acyl-CoA dehydrogenase family protein [Streptomyces sp. NPDC057257]|uniref:acyl-CoA dehydrogenase family protein n=1 Tax=Streptomyces sp. NPDC057257 TaxID=3346071 RepID=UPI003635D35E